MKIHLLKSEYPLAVCGARTSPSQSTFALVEVTCRACRKAEEQTLKSARRREKQHAKPHP